MEKISKIENNHFTLHLKKSQLAKPTLITLNDKNYVIIPENEYMKMQETIKSSTEELILRILEKEIRQEMPKDFDDVFIVAKQMLLNIKGKKKHLTNYDIKKVVKEIRTNYPNLFFDIDEHFRELHRECDND